MIAFNLRQAKLDFLRPIVDELDFLEEQQRESEARISQVSLLYPEEKKRMLLYKHRNVLNVFALQLNAEIEEYNEARERELPLVQEVDAKVKELRQTIAGLNNQQMSMRASYRKLKEKAGEMDEKVRRLWKISRLSSKLSFTNFGFARTTRAIVSCLF